MSFIEKIITILKYVKENHPKKFGFIICVIIYQLYKRIFRRRYSVKNKVILITGGGSGLGKNMAIRLAAMGARVVLWDINERALNAVGKELTQANGGMLYNYVCDVTSRQDVFRVAQRVMEDVGPVDILVNNAGVVSGKYIEELSEADVLRTYKVNIIAHYWTIQAFLPSMMKQNSGLVVNIASASGYTGVPKLTDYCGSKWAACGLDEALRSELVKRGFSGIRTLRVCPFYINTGMFDGAKSKWPLLLPILKEDYVAKSIIKAMQDDVKELSLPSILYLGLALKPLLPVTWGDAMQKFLGVQDGMDDFMGRKKN